MTAHANSYAHPARTVCRRGEHDLRAPAAIYVDCLGRRLCAACWKRRYTAQNRKAGHKPRGSQRLSEALLAANT